MKIYYSLFISLFFILTNCTKEKEFKQKHISLSESESKKLQKDLDILRMDTTIINDSLIAKSNILLLNYPNNKADVNEKIAHVFYRKSNFHLTKIYFEKSAEEYLKDSMQLRYAEQLTNIGVLNELMGNYPKALDNYYEALSIFENNDLELKSSFVYNNLGIVYQQLKERDKSIKLYKKSLKIDKKN